MLLARHREEAEKLAVAKINANPAQTSQPEKVPESTPDKETKTAKPSKPEEVKEPTEPAA